VFWTGINGSRRVARTWPLHVERSGRPSHRTDEYVKKVRNPVHSDRCLGITATAVQLHLDKETVTCVKKGLNFGPMIGISIFIKLHLTRCCHAISGPKAITEMENPPYSPD